MNTINTFDFSASLSICVNASHTSRTIYYCRCHNMAEYHYIVLLPNRAHSCAVWIIYFDFISIFLLRFWRNIREVRRAGARARATLVCICFLAARFPCERIIAFHQLLKFFRQFWKLEESACSYGTREMPQLQTE